MWPFFFSSVWAASQADENLTAARFCRVKAKSMLHEYSQKIKAVVQEGVSRKGEGGAWDASLTVAWFGSAPVRGTGQGPSKKAALNADAFAVLAQIADSTSM
jgi:hypothetical protein